MQRIVMLSLTCLWLVACDSSTGTDAGTTPPDADARADAGPTDAGFDAGFDAGPPLCGGIECGTDEMCVREVCLATCGADLSGWEAALSADLTPVFTFCRTADAFGTEIDATGTIVRDVTAMAMTDGTSLTLAEWRADVSAGQPTPTDISTSEVTHPAELLLFAGGYVVRGATGHLFGYTLNDMASTGAVLHIADDGAQAELDASGNFDAAVLLGDVFLVNSLQLGSTPDTGEGVYSMDAAMSYATRLAVTDLDTYSGGVAVAPEYVLVGSLDDSFVSHLYVVPRAPVEAAVMAGGFPVPDPTEVLYDGAPLPSAFALINDQIVTTRYDDSFAIEALQAHPVGAYDATTGLTVEAPVDLTTGSTFTSAYAAAGDRMLLRFAGGLLLVE